MIVAVAVLFAPALTRAGEAFAAVPDHHMQMMESGHCKSAPSHSGDDDQSSDKAAGKTCCITMCMAVAVAPLSPTQAADLHGAAAPFALIHQYHGCIAEIATPPPRLA